MRWGTFERDIEVLLCPFPLGNKFCPVKWTKTKTKTKKKACISVYPLMDTSSSSLRTHNSLLSLFLSCVSVDLNVTQSKV